MRKINLNTVGRWFKKNSPIILSVIGSGGVVLTSILSGKAALKAKAVGIVRGKKEAASGSENVYYYNNEPVIIADKPKLTIKDKIKIFAPPVISGIATMVAITGSAILGRKQYNNLAAAYLLLGQSYREYQKKNIEINGKEAHDRVIDSIAAEAAKRQRITADTLGSVCSLTSEDDREEEKLFYDYYSNRYFTSTLSAVIEAEYHLNRNFARGDGGTLNDFYRFLGIDTIKGGDECTWDYLRKDGIVLWIDFDNRKTVFDDGLTCYIITTVFPPEKEECFGNCRECEIRCRGYYECND